MWFEFPLWLSGRRGGKWWFVYRPERYLKICCPGTVCSKPGWKLWVWCWRWSREADPGPSAVQHPRCFYVRQNKQWVILLQTSQSVRLESRYRTYDVGWREWRVRPFPGSAWLGWAFFPLTCLTKISSYSLDRLVSSKPPSAWLELCRQQKIYTLLLTTSLFSVFHHQTESIFLRSKTDALLVQLAQWLLSMLWRISVQLYGQQYFSFAWNF